MKNVRSDRRMDVSTRIGTPIGCLCEITEVEDLR